MKNLTTTLAAFFIAVASFGQSKSVASFTDKYKDHKAASVVTLNGGIFELISNIASFSDDEESETLSRIAKGIKSMNILSIPMDVADMDVAQIDALRNNVKKEGYEELLTVRDGKERAYFLAQTNDKQIKNMLILTNKDAEEFAVISLEGILEMKDIAYIMDNHDKLGK